MKKKFTFFKTCFVAALFLLTCISQADAQIVKNSPTQLDSTTGGCLRCSVATISNAANSLTADTTTYAEILTRRSGVVVGQKWAQLVYDIQPSTDNQNIFVRLTASKNTAEPEVSTGIASSTEGGTTINLSHQGVLLPTSAVKLMEFRDAFNNTWYRLTTSVPFDQLVVRVTSKNYDIDYDRHVRSAKIYSVFTTQGSATLNDCGTPTMVAFEAAIDGVPLAGPVTARLWEAIDGDFASHTSGVLAGLVNIGAPTWNYTTLFNGLSGETSTLKLTLGRGATIVNLSGVRYKVHFMRNGTTFNSTDWTTLQVLGLLAINSYEPLTFYHEAPGAFDEIRLEIQVPGISVTGEMIRVYDIRRTVPEPTLSGSLSSTMDVERGTFAQVKATGAASEYLWYQGVNFTDPDTQLSGYILNKAVGLLQSTIGQATSTPLKTITEFSFGPITQDSVIFVRSVRAACPTDTSAAHAIMLRVFDRSLPVTLSSISAARQDTKAIVQWTTTDEINNQYFEIQRSEDARTWKAIGKVLSKNINGTGKDLNNYQHTDDMPINGINYYRLIQVDYDGTATESRIVSVVMEGLKNPFSYVYPNPAITYFKITTTAGSEVIIYDMFGRVMDRRSTNSSTQDLSFEVGQLPTGNYFIHVIQDGNTEKHLLQIQR